MYVFFIQCQKFLYEVRCTLCGTARHLDRGGASTRPLPVQTTSGSDMSALRVAGGGFPGDDSGPRGSKTVERPSRLPSHFVLGRPEARCLRTSSLASMSVQAYGGCTAAKVEHGEKDGAEDEGAWRSATRGQGQPHAIPEQGAKRLLEGFDPWVFEFSLQGAEEGPSSLHDAVARRGSSWLGRLPFGLTSVSVTQRREVLHKGTLHGGELALHCVAEYLASIQEHLDAPQSCREPSFKRDGNPAY